jgi:hypothetical protein
MCITQLVEGGLGHYAHADPKVTQGMIKDLGPNWAGEVGHPGSFFFSSRRLSIAVLHSFVSFTISVDGNGHLLLMMSLMYLV